MGYSYNYNSVRHIYHIKEPQNPEVKTTDNQTEKGNQL